MGNTDNNFLKRRILPGCLILAAVFILSVIILAFAATRKRGETEKPEFIKEVEQDVQRNEEEISRRRKLFSNNNKKKYDLDQTVMALFSIERALTGAGNFQDLTPYIVQKESDRVAVDVAELKYRFFNIYKRILDAQDELGELGSIYNVTAGTVIDVAGIIGFDPVKGIVYDREQARKVWEKRLAESKMESEIRARLRSHQDKMLDFLFDYADTSIRHLRKWNRLCAARDRAYLALYENDWDQVIESSQIACDMSPTEKEAHVLLAMALVERGKESDKGRAMALVEDMLEKHDGQPAPAYLLRGVMRMNEKKYEEAMLDFDQASAYYPKQQQALSDKLNLYRKRSFLNNSKEGRMIVNTYRGIMTGSGYFSPDFQKARIHLAKGEKDKAEKKIFDHFFRRRLQGQWDRVLMDFKFCSRYLKTDLKEIFRGDEVDLIIKPAWLSNSVVVSVKNNGDADVHNITLLFCVRFTDMFIGDYISFPIGDSLAVLHPGEEASVGRKNITELTEERLGEVKKWEDIIDYGAVLIADEMLAWIEPKSREPLLKPETEPVIDEDTRKKARGVLKKALKKSIDSIEGAMTEEKKEN